jgi:hypothetical protein
LADIKLEPLTGLRGVLFSSSLTGIDCRRKEKMQQDRGNAIQVEKSTCKEIVKVLLEETPFTIEA